MSGSDIRKFFRELFGSRLVESLEFSILNIRQDCEFRLRDKDEIIATLREEKAALTAKIILYETSLLPLSSRAGADVVKTARPLKPNFKSMDFTQIPPIKTSWEAIQEAHYKQLVEEAAISKAV